MTHLLTTLRKIPAFIWTAFLLRAAWAATIGMEPVSDSAMYRAFALSIANGAGYAFPDGQLTVYWAVGTSAFYALIHSLFGTSLAFASAANLIVGVALVHLTYLVALRYFGEKVAIGAGWLMAVWPVLIEFTTIYASEVLFMFLLLAAIYVWGMPRLNTWLKAALWGGLLCLATYVRPTALPLFFLLPALHFWIDRDWRSAFASGLIASVTAAMLFAPWVVRNQQLFGQPVLVSANFGSNLWMGNNPASNGGYMPLPDIQFRDEVVRDQYFKRLAVDFIKANPVEYVKLSFKRFIQTYDRETIGIAWNESALRRLGGERFLQLSKLVSTLYWWAIAVCGAIGVCWAVLARKSRELHPLLVVGALFFVVPILTVGQDRYHLPLDPLLALFAAFALHNAWRTFRERN